MRIGELQRPHEVEDWYCPACKAYVSGESVSFDEVHTTCGTYIGESQDEIHLRKCGMYWMTYAPWILIIPFIIVGLALLIASC